MPTRPSRRISEASLSSGEVSNPDYESLKTSEQSAERDYKTCRAAYGEANCAGSKNNFEVVRTQRRNTPEWFKYDYTYVRRVTSVRGQNCRHTATPVSRHRQGRSRMIVVYCCGIDDRHLRKLLKNGGDDETHNRDLCRDRAAF